MIFVLRPSVHPSCSYYPPPLILKRGGLESSDERLISSNGQPKLIAFVWQKLRRRRYLFFFFFLYLFLIILDIFLMLSLVFLFLRYLLKVTKVTTEHQKMPKMGKNCIISPLFCPKGKKSLGRRPNPSAGALRVAGHNFKYIYILHSSPKHSMYCKVAKIAEHIPVLLDVIWRKKSLINRIWFTNSIVRKHNFFLILILDTRISGLWTLSVRS